MPSLGVEVLRRILLHNKLVSEADIDRVLAINPHPEQAVDRLVEANLLSLKTASQVLALYHKQVEAARAEQAAKAAGLPPGVPAHSLHAPHAASAQDPSKSAVRSVPVARSIPPSPGSTSPAAVSSTRVASSADTIVEPSRATAGPGAPAAKRTGPATAGESARPAPTTAQTAEAATAVPAAAAVPTRPQRPVRQIVRTIDVPGLAPDHPQPGPQLILRLLQAARQVGASDLHIKTGMTPAVRVAGSLRDLPVKPLSFEVCEGSLLPLLTVDDRARFLETSDLDFSYDGGPELGRFRANYLRQHRGLDAAFRLISSRVPSFAELKLPDTVARFTDYRVGVVLVTGPKGCGKTTTLAAMIDLINTKRADHIITLEDPIEFVHPCKVGHVNQRQVGTHTQSFSNALRASLREAPDVIMVGEMRDLETTSLAITAAETGHLVLATLHTPDALRTIGRVLDAFPAKEQGQIRAMLSESLRGIVSQQLIPSLDGNSMHLALEILVNTPAISHLIREERVFQIKGLMQTGKKQGMLLMDESLIKLAKQGAISHEDALALADELPYVSRQLSMN